MSRNRMFQNAKWIICCKVVQSLLQMMIGMISARYLGPSNYGLISYAASVTAFAVPFMQLGLNETLIREYIAEPEQESTVAGTALVLNLISAVSCMVCVTGMCSIMNRGETVTILVCAIYSFSLLFQALEMVQYWFHAKLMSKYSSVSMLLSYVAVSAYKIFLLVTRRSIYWFALVHSVEFGMTGILLLVVYKRVTHKKLCFSWVTAKSLLSRSKYYIPASLMVIVFQNTDHIMLKLMDGDRANGYYTTAVTCAGVVGFVYNAIIDSARPVILESRSRSKSDYERNIIRLYCLIIYLTLAQSVCFTLLAKQIVLLLYGKEFLPAVPVLQVLVWQVSFSRMGSVRNVWILAEEKHNLLWKVNLCGAMTNIVLNGFFIPEWGAAGAAFASVLTQIAVNFIIGFLMKSVRDNNRLLLTGFNPRYLLELYRIRKI